MIFTFKKVGPETVIDIRGRLTFSDYSNFREMTQMLTEYKTKNCQIDLTGLEFIDSAGLGMLLIARDKIRAVDGQISLIGAQGQVKKMLDLGHFDRLFQVA